MSNVSHASQDGQLSAETKVIPASRRPDGTLRKEIRVRAGYVPPDEVARYEARGSKVQILEQYLCI